MTAGTLALWIGAAFASLAAVASCALRPSTDRATIAARALTMAAAFTTVALGFLVDALRRSDLSVDFVARHAMLSVPVASRLLAVFADPAGTGLAIAAGVGMVAAWCARRSGRPSHGTTGVAAGVMLVMLAAPLSGRPLVRLPWVPLDGGDPLLFFRHPMAMVMVLAVVGAVTAATLATGRWVDAWVASDADAVNGAQGAASLAALCVGWQAMAHTQASVVAGLTREASPLTARNGSWTIVLVVVLLSRAVAGSRYTSAQSRVCVSLAAVLATVSTALVPPGSDGPVPSVRWLVWLSLAVLVAGAATNGRGLVDAALHLLAGARARRVGSVLASAALGLGLLAAAGGAFARTTDATLASGGTVSMGGGSELVHLGVSRYDDDASQVVALGLERRGAAGAQLGSAEQREYADARGGVVKGLVRSPATFSGAVPMLVWLEDVGSGDQARLSIATRPDWWLWWLALGFFTLSVAAVAFGSAPARPLASPFGAPGA